MFKTVVYVIVDPVANNVKSEQSETKPQKYVLLFALLTNTMTHKTKVACLACLIVLFAQMRLSV